MDIITLGIGPQSDIPTLVLTGLTTFSEPPPDIAEASPATLIVLFEDYITNSGVASDSFAVADRCVQIEWQTSYDSAPLAAEVFLQGSFDGLRFLNLDSTTEVAGEIRRVNTSVPFIRALLGTTTAGTEITVKAVCKFVKLGGI